MSLVQNLNMRNGLAVIGRKQTAGVGRHKNQVLYHNDKNEHLKIINENDKFLIKIKMLLFNCDKVVESRWLCTIFTTITYSIIKSIGSKDTAFATFSIGCHCQFDYKI